MYVCEFRTVEPDPYFILSASVSSARAVTGSWRAASQTAEMTNRGWKVWELQQSLAPPPLTYSTPTAEMSQHNHRKPSPLQLCKLGEWCKSDASAKPASLQGGHLGGVCQPRSKRQELSQRSCQLREWERGVGSASRPVPAPGKSGRLLGCLAEWLAGWRRGWLGDHVAPLCKLELSTTPVPPPPLLHPSPTLDGRTHRCLQKLQRTVCSSPLSEVRPK